MQKTDIGPIVQVFANLGLIAGVGLFALQPGTARADVDPAFARVVMDPKEQAMVIDAAKHTSVVVEDSCENPFVTIRPQVKFDATPKFDQDGKLVSGSWQQEIFYAGCTVARTLRVLVTVDPGSRPSARALFPGTTRADPVLQKDVFESPDLQRRLESWRDPKCEKTYVDDTVFIDQEAAAPGKPAPRWEEAWTIAACGRKNVIIVVFTPDATGTTFVVLGKTAK